MVCVVALRTPAAVELAAVKETELPVEEVTVTADVVVLVPRLVAGTLTVICPVDEDAVAMPLPANVTVSVTLALSVNLSSAAFTAVFATASKSYVVLVSTTVSFPVVYPVT
jgi:hypothetical protein